MATRDQLFPSRYLKAADVGRGMTATILAAEQRPFKDPKTGEDQQKLMIEFKELDKALICNATNFDSITDILGEGDTDQWPGHKIELYSTSVKDPSGRTVDSIRVRSARETGPSQPKEYQPRQAAPKSEPALADDEIPF